jgi:hypothetical protein
LATAALSAAEKSGLTFADCRGQSHDNASNMAGAYKGLQRLILSKYPLAEYKPCTTHSLNLCGMQSVSCCPQAIQFFCFVQQLYNFFSASTRRWQVMLDNIREDGRSRFLVLEALSVTRWARHADATRALSKQYSIISKAVKDLSESSFQTPDTLHDGQSLLKKLQRLQTRFIMILWNVILQ